MSEPSRQWLRDAAIYFVKAIAFAVGSYILMLVIYGGARISFWMWSLIVTLAFAVAYVPYFVRAIKSHGSSKNKEDG
jgi:Ca2+/Na+ antiporter